MQLIFVLWMKVKGNMKRILTKPQAGIPKDSFSLFGNFERQNFQTRTDIVNESASTMP